MLRTGGSPASNSTPISLITAGFGGIPALTGRGGMDGIEPIGGRDVGAGADGGAGGGALFVLASIAALRSSLSSPANMIPDRVPVKNVAIGIINSKNLLSTGDIPFIGCVTKISEYRTTNTMPNNVKPRIQPIKNFKRALSSSVVYFSPSNKLLIICMSPSQWQVWMWMWIVVDFSFHNGVSLLDKFRQHYTMVSYKFVDPNYQDLGMDNDILNHMHLVSE